MNGMELIKLFVFCSFINYSLGIHEFNNYIQKYSFSLYTNFGDPSFQIQYIKEYNFIMKSNLEFETTKTRIESLNHITNLFCKSKILNFVTQSLIDKRIINENFEIMIEESETISEKQEIIEDKVISEDGGKKEENEHYLDKKRKKIKIKGKVYEIPDSWVKRGIETWNDFQNHVLEMLSGEYRMVNEDFRSNLSKVIDGLNSIDLDEISHDLVIQYGFLEASYIKHYINFDFSDEEEEEIENDYLKRKKLAKNKLNKKLQFFCF